MSTTTTLQNFIGGIRRSGRGSDGAGPEPGHGRAIAQAPVSTAADVERAVEAARKAFPEWGVTTPGERAQALLKLADAIEEHGEEIAELEADNAGKPITAVREDEIPFMVDNLRFFAGAARTPRGPLGGRVCERLHVVHPPRAGRRVGQIAPWNYPLMMAIWKIGPALAAGNTIVLKPAETTPLTTLEARRVRGRDPARRRPERDHGSRRAGGTGAGHPRRRRHGLADGLGRYRQVDRAQRRGHAQARPPRARRQGARGRVRRRGHGDRDGDDRRDRVLQRGSGLHRGDAGARERQGP